MSIHAVIRSARFDASRGRASGQAMVEFALVAPVFFLLLFGVIEGGRFIFYYQTLNNATREGARYAIVHGSNSACPSGPMPVGSTKASCNLNASNVKDRVIATAIGMNTSEIMFPAIVPCLSSAATTNPCYDQSDNARSHTVTIVARYTYTTLVPLVPLPSITVAAESSLVVNN